VKLLDKTDEYQKADKLYGDYPEFLRLISLFDFYFPKGKEKEADKIEISYAFSLGLVIEREFFSNRIKERAEAKRLRLLAEKQKSEA
jgi:hypothetical protein